MERLPEECVCEILKRTTPRDVSRSSAISRGMKQIADSDAVWNELLPSDMEDILSKIADPLVYPNNKKSLYFLLSRQPLLLSPANLSLAIDRESGKKCYMLGARELTITWGTFPEYWQWTSIDGSRFPEVAILLNVCWFEINCKIETRILSHKTAYVAFLVFKLTESCDFDSLPINVSIKYLDEMGDENRYEILTATVVLDVDPTEPFPEDCKIPVQRNEEWSEVELGEFFVNPDDNRLVEIRLFEVDRGNWKCGLIIEGFELRPKAIA